MHLRFARMAIPCGHDADRQSLDLLQGFGLFRVEVWVGCRKEQLHLRRMRMVRNFWHQGPSGHGCGSA